MDQKVWGFYTYAKELNFYRRLMAVLKEKRFRAGTENVEVLSEWLLH
jgi:hypothetical protein